MSNQRLSGHVAVITGCASGIGRASMLLFAKHGARVAAIDRDLDMIKQSVPEERRAEILPLEADVTNSNAVMKAVDESEKRFGDPTILVNCAGTVGLGGPMGLTDDDSWDELFRVNAKGTFICIKHVLPLMQRNKRGSIVNIASTAGLVGSALLGAYSASKGAVVLMSRSLALGYAADGIRVNCVCPGSIETPMLTQSFRTAGDPESQKRMEAQYLQKHPLGRFGRAEEVAAAIMFLASDEASFITGVSLPVDGGRIA